MIPFSNQTYIDFSNPDNVKKQLDAISKVESKLGREYPNIIGGKEIFSEKKTKSINPANPDQVVGIFQKSGADQAELAINTAYETFKWWRNFPPVERAEFLFKAAEYVRKHRYEINAWMIKEVGKNYAEADGDVSEGIDFFEYYGREMLRYMRGADIPSLPGEFSEYGYIPLGVGVIIPPWNFPFAIMAGMSAAAIVTGNTVVLKPSSDAPMMAYLFARIMEEVGLPAGVLNFLVASGSETGDYIVDHPKTRFISFTGSVDVGKRIYERAAIVHPGQIWLKRVIAEMGGKDTLIIDSEAPCLDEAVNITITSAYGFQGQKCSACSRVVVDDKVYDEFLDKLIKATEALPIGEPTENYRIGPVVSASAEKTILEYIEIAKKEGKIVVGGNKLDRQGYFIQPTIVTDVAPDSRISQEEIFGPVLAVLRAKDFDEALAIANNTQYGLTGGVCTVNREKIIKAKRDFHVGNLYFNRKITGAMVGSHPFGGFNMSGTDSKTGSPDYLLLYMQGKAISELL